MSKLSNDIRIDCFLKMDQHSGKNMALLTIVAMQKEKVVDRTVSLTMAASRISLEHQLPMADKIILATAKAYKAIIWTQNSDFKHLSGVKNFPKNKDPQKINFSTPQYGFGFLP
jgi:predicted nucleic acid-binding protein